jgi:hypothetical protein
MLLGHAYSEVLQHSTWSNHLLHGVADHCFHRCFRHPDGRAAHHFTHHSRWCVPSLHAGLGFPVRLDIAHAYSALCTDVADTDTDLTMRSQQTLPSWGCRCTMWGGTMASATASSWVRTSCMHPCWRWHSSQRPAATVINPDVSLDNFLGCPGLPVLVLIVLFSQYFRKLYIPLPRGHK